MRTLNLGILAHVDAGKTSLTERLLHAAGVIDEIGSVDDGNTQTDSLALERQRGVPTVIPMGVADGLGTRGARCTPYTAADAGFTSRLAELLADRNDAFLAAYVDDERTVSYGQLRGELAAQTQRALVHPVYSGSAITGAGVEALIAGITELLPAAEGDADGPVSGTVFKVERGPAANSRRPLPPHRQRCAACRAHPTRRAGPADQPAPGRHAQRSIRLALRRGAERGHPGNTGGRLRR
ncbi:GTP-binding protein [Streptomyces sp. 7N604]|uniref:GTP-binding protein n=1 Tax=Streptomyces sp. 7N604 TaxID=3457415 RepID=UPI003FD494FD